MYTHTHRPYFKGRRILHKALGVRADLIHTPFPTPLSTPAVFSGNQWVVRQPTLATDLNASGYWAFSETYSSGNSGLTELLQRWTGKLLQLIKTRKNPKHSIGFKYFYEPKKKINSGIIKMFRQDIYPDPKHPLTPLPQSSLTL